MQKTKLIIVMFIMALFMGAGASLFLVEDAQACICEAPYQLILSCDTGPNCANPSYPYYSYQQSIPCPSCYEWVGCTNGVKAGC